MAANDLIDLETTNSEPNTCFASCEATMPSAVSKAHLMDMENDENYADFNDDNVVENETCCCAAVDLSDDDAEIDDDDENSVTPTPSTAVKETATLYYASELPTKSYSFTEVSQHNSDSQAMATHQTTSTSSISGAVRERSLLVDDDELEFYVDLAVHESQRWLEALTRIRFQSADLLSSVANGRILCEALETIWPGITVASMLHDADEVSNYYFTKNTPPNDRPSSSLAIFRATCIEKLCINALDVLHRRLFTAITNTDNINTGSSPIHPQQVAALDTDDGRIICPGGDALSKTPPSITSPVLPVDGHQLQTNLYNETEEVEQHEIYELDNQASTKILRSQSNLIRVVINIYLIGVLAQDYDNNDSPKTANATDCSSISPVPLKSALPRLDLSAFTQLYCYYLRFIRPHLVAQPASSALDVNVVSAETQRDRSTDALLEQHAAIMPAFHEQQQLRNLDESKVSNGNDGHNKFQGTDERDDAGPNVERTNGKSTTVMSNRDHEMFVLMQKESVSGTMSPSFASSTLSTSSSSCSHSAVLSSGQQNPSPPASSAASPPLMSEMLNVIVETVEQKQQQTSSSYTTGDSVSDGENVNDSELDGIDSTEDDLVGNTSPHPNEKHQLASDEQHDGQDFVIQKQNAASLYVLRTAITTTTSTTVSKEQFRQDHRRAQSDSAAEEDSLNSYENDDGEPETPKHDATLQQQQCADECVGTDDRLAPLATENRRLDSYHQQNPDAGKRFHRDVHSRTSNTSLISNTSSVTGGGGSSGFSATTGGSGKLPLAATFSGSGNAAAAAALLVVKPDPLQFIKADPAHAVPRVIHDSLTTYEQAQQLHAKLREEELEWESNLDSWKSRRRVSTKEDGSNDDESGDQSPSSSQIRKFADIQADREQRRLSRPHERYRGIEADLLQKGVIDDAEAEFRATQSDDESAARQAVVTTTAAYPDDHEDKQPFGDSVTRGSLRKTVSRSSLPNVAIRPTHQISAVRESAEKQQPMMAKTAENRPETKTVNAAPPVVVEKKLDQRISMLVAAAADGSSISTTKPVVIDTVPSHAPSNPDIVTTGIPFHQKLLMFRATSQENNDATDGRPPISSHQQRALSIDRSHVPTKKLFHIVPEGENEQPLVQPSQTASGRSSSLSAQGNSANNADRINKKISHWLARDLKNSNLQQQQAVTATKTSNARTVDAPPPDRISGAMNISSGANTVTFDFTKPPTQFVMPPPMPRAHNSAADATTVQTAIGNVKTIEQIKITNAKQTATSTVTSSAEVEKNLVPATSNATLPPTAVHTKQLSENSNAKLPPNAALSSSSLAGSSTSLLTTTSSSGSSANNSNDSATNAGQQSSDAAVVKKPKKKVILIDLNEIERQQQQQTTMDEQKPPQNEPRREISHAPASRADELLTPVAPTDSTAMPAETLDNEEVEEMARFQGELSQSLELEAERWKRRVEQPQLKVEYRKVAQQSFCADNEVHRASTQTAAKTEQQFTAEKPSSILKQPAATATANVQNRILQQQTLDAKRKPQQSLQYAEAESSNLASIQQHQQQKAAESALRLAEKQRQWLLQEEAELRRQEEAEEATLRQQQQKNAQRRSSIAQVTAIAATAAENRRLRSNNNNSRPQSQYVYSGPDHERILVMQRTLPPAHHHQQLQQHYAVHQHDYQQQQYITTRNTPQMRQRSADISSSSNSNSASYRHSYHSQVNGNGYATGGGGGGGGDVLSLAPSYTSSATHATEADHQQQVYRDAAPHLYQYEQPYGSIAAPPARANGKARNNAHRNATIYNDTVGDGGVNGEYAIDYGSTAVTADDERSRRLYDSQHRNQVQRQQPVLDHHRKTNDEYAVVPSLRNTSIMPNSTKQQHHNQPPLMPSVDTNGEPPHLRRQQQHQQQRTSHEQQQAVAVYSERHQQPVPLPHASSYDNSAKQAPKHTVSGSKLCSHCQMPLGKGAAMVVGTLNLYYHVKCFRCSVCGISLGSGLEGADVRVRNYKLHCSSCYSDEDGILQSVI